MSRIPFSCLCGAEVDSLQLPTGLKAPNPTCQPPSFPTTSQLFCFLPEICFVLHPVPRGCTVRISFPGLCSGNLNPPCHYPSIPSPDCMERLLQELRRKPAAETGLSTCTKISHTTFPFSEQKLAQDLQTRQLCNIGQSKSFVENP